MRYVVDAIDHPQQDTPFKTDIYTTIAFAHKNVNQKRSKSWDMIHHWLRCRETTKQIKLCQEKGTNDHAEYFTKHHPTKFHTEIRSK